MGPRETVCEMGLETSKFAQVFRLRMTYPGGAFFWNNAPGSVKYMLSTYAHHID